MKKAGIAPGLFHFYCIFTVNRKIGMYFTTACLDIG